MNSDNDEVSVAGPPEAPQDEDCCGQGCNPCIFDVYRESLKKWNEKDTVDKQLYSQKNYLSPLKYKRFTVQDKIKTSLDCIKLVVKCEGSNPIQIYASQHVIIRMQSVSKPYTPILWSPSSMTFLIKLYPNGKASKYIEEIKLDSDIYIRGPYNGYKYRENSYPHILMFSVGSGIAPLYSIIHEIVHNDNEESRIQLFSGFHSILHVPLKDELRSLAQYWNFKCTICLASNSVDAFLSGINLVQRKINTDFVSEILKKHDKYQTLILICGTSQFNTSVEAIVKENQFSILHIFQ